MLWSCHYYRPQTYIVTTGHPTLNKKLFQKIKALQWVNAHGILWFFFLFYHVPNYPEGAGLKEEWIGLLKTQLQQQVEDNILRLGYYPIWCSDLVNNIWYSFSINRIPRVEWQLSLLHLNFTCKYFISQSHGFGLSWFKDLMMQRKTISTRGHTIECWGCHLVTELCVPWGQQGKKSHF